MWYILGNASAFTNESLDQSSEEWIAECLNDTEMDFNHDYLYGSLDFIFLVQPLSYINLISLLCETQEFFWGIRTVRYHRYMWLFLLYILFTIVSLYFFLYFLHAALVLIHFSYFYLVDLCDMPPEYEANVVQKTVTQTPQKIVFRGFFPFSIFVCRLCLLWSKDLWIFLILVIFSMSMLQPFAGDNWTCSHDLLLWKPCHHSKK